MYGIQSSYSTGDQNGDVSVLTKAIGHHSHWGLSATFDLIEAIDMNRNNQSEVLNVLLLQPGDIRHVLTTIARRRRHRRGKRRLPQVNIYLLENPIEVLARDLAMLHVFYDFEVPIRQRANVFLEIYGNSKVQRRTAVYLETIGKSLVELIRSNKGTGPLGFLLDLSLLRYRERDALEEAFLRYSRSDEFFFDIHKLLDHRRRGLYEDRFDSRKALYDWDYHAGVKSSASIVHIKQYREWRESGIAFEFGDQQYTEANKTLLTYTEGVMKRGKDRGIKKEVQGFWGDIVCSPFFGLGVDVDCDQTDKFANGLFEIYNKNTGTEQHRHHAVEVCLFNLFSFLWECETGETYRMNKANDIYSGLGQEAKYVKLQEEEEKEKEEEVLLLECGDDEVVEEQQQQEQLKEGDHLLSDLTKMVKRAETISETFSDIRIFCLSGTPTTVLDKPRFRGLFDCVFVSTRAAHLLGDPLLMSLLSEEKPLVAVEGSKFVVPINAQTKLDFNRKIDEFANNNGMHKIKAPVSRRRRDESDLVDDVLFFSR